MNRKEQFAFLLCILVATTKIVPAQQPQQPTNPLPDLSQYAKLTDVPTPFGSTPLGPLLNGAAAPSDKTYVPGTATQRQGVMRINVPTDATGFWSVTWGNGFSFLSTNPTLVTQAGNPGGTNSIDCNWLTKTQTGATGKCWQNNQSLLTILGISVFSFNQSTPAINTPVSVVMAEPTQ